MESEPCVAWAAGLYEGEGHIVYSERHYVWRIAVTSTDRDVLEKFQEVVGCGKIRQREERPGHKACFVWMTARADDVWHIIDLLWPWLGSRRQDQIMDTVLRRSDKLSSRKCKGCGCDYDERTEGCSRCYQRHYRRAATR